MKKVFIDTNIIIDLIADRKPFSKFTLEIFKKAEDKKLILYTSSHSIATTHYLLKKYIDEKTIRKILINLLEYVKTIPIDETILNQGLHSRHKDFEDALQIFSAASISKIDCIITRNTKDFSFSEIPVMSPDEFCLKN